MPRKKNLPAPPVAFTDAMTEAWTVILADLQNNGRLDDGDLVMVESAAVMWGRARELRAEINASPYIVPTVRGTTTNPLLGAERECLKELRLLCDQLPLTSAGRRKLGLSGDGKKVDPFADLDAPTLRAVQ